MSILLNRLTVFSTSIFMLGAMIGMGNQAYADQRQGHYKQQQSHYKHKQENFKQEHNRYKYKPAHYKQTQNRYNPKWGNYKQKYRSPAYTRKSYAKSRHIDSYAINHRHYNAVPSERGYRRY